jgi:two-component SAPR family response regulator
MYLVKTILISIPILEYRNDVINHLEQSPFQIICSDNSGTSLDIIRANAVNLVVLDIGNDFHPTLSFIKEVQMIDTQCSFVCLGNYIDDDIKHKFAKFQCEWIQRPFTRNETNQKVQKLLAPKVA